MLCLYIEDVEEC